MTDEQLKKLTNFETRIRQLMLLCETLRKENIRLEKNLSSRDAELKTAKENIRNLTIQYDNLKLTKMISQDETELKKAQRRISGLVRDIDRCIALINE